jgi:hypothetical protein
MRLRKMTGRGGGGDFTSSVSDRRVPPVLGQTRENRRTANKLGQQLAFVDKSAWLGWCKGPRWG